MSDIWKQWVGQTVDNRFPLQQYLNHTEHSAVFLTEFTDTEKRKAAIKFVTSDTPGAEKQLSLWSQVAQLHHPNLLPVYHAGRCRITEMDLLYVVMEFADENLAQILPQRALLPEETRQMLDPIVDALVYLHDKGLAHGHIKPSNVLAVGDLLKLSSDTITNIGETHDAQRERDVYDAPELGSAPMMTAAADIWSLGQTLVETLTQQPAALPFNDQADPIVPESIPQPFQNTAQHALRREPKRRWTSAQIAAQLNPVAAPATRPEPIAVAAAAGAVGQISASPAAPIPPLSVPLSREPAVPLAKLQNSVAPRAHSVAAPAPRPMPAESAEKDVVLPNYVVPLVLAGTLVLIAVLALPKLFSHQPKAGVATSASSSASNSLPNGTPLAATAKSADSGHSPSSMGNSKPSNPSVAAPAKPEPPSSTNSFDQSKPPQPATRAAVTSAAPAVLRTDNFPNVNAPKHSSDSPNKGEVLDEILPTASDRALATIQGTVRVTVHLQVDPAGRVSNADLYAPGPSKYFSSLALKAAQEWTFASPEANGHSLPSEWLVRFEFSPSGAKAYPTQTVP
jgi:TonB family protein